MILSDTGADHRPKPLLSLAWPIFVEQSLRILVGIVSTLVVSHISDGAVAALGVANQILFFFILSFNFIGVGSSVVLTHFLGARDRKGADAVARAAIVANTWIGIAFGLFVFFLASALLGWMNLPADLLGEALPFLRIMGGTLCLEAFNASMAGVLRAHKQTRVAMAVGVGQNAVNLAGSLIFIFGWLGAPVLGVFGVAIAGLLSRVCASGALLFALSHRIGFRLRPRDFAHPEWNRVRSVLRIGAPAAAENLCYWTAFMFVTRQVAALGAGKLAAQEYTMQIQSFVIMFTMAIALANEIMVGHFVGAGRLDSAYRQTLASVRLGLFIAMGAVILVALATPWLVGRFTPDRRIVESCAWLIRISIVLEGGRVFNLIVINALRATGDAKFPFRMAVLSMWMVWVPMAWGAVHAGFGLSGVWAAMATDEWIRGLLMLRRWRKRKWIASAEHSRRQAGPAVSAAIAPAHSR
jgi:putative MATE family efflux protein